ncbi:hypothetical protein MAIT1_02741 [Magnetofaba australis IT-1]|uniref:Uncharacterized protein n=1 Tax=Magnetofaba australis IT-1 TaxID=1434232 RepID=A0A1Y2K3G2_9PROT|nr:hypothetical protein MAIT1_02741 [Magnetofaba australis IT-1]
MIRFAEFLHQEQQQDARAAQHAPSAMEPLAIPAPAKETSVAALKRLKKSYPMIEADAALLDDASKLLMERMMGGDDAEVIPKLERLFAQRYTDWRAQQAEITPSVPE